MGNLFLIIFFPQVIIHIHILQIFPFSSPPPPLENESLTQKLIKIIHFSNTLRLFLLSYRFQVSICYSLRPTAISKRHHIFHHHLPYRYVKVTSFQCIDWVQISTVTRCLHAVTIAFICVCILFWHNDSNES